MFDLSLQFTFKLLKMIYTVIVWYRYVSNGEQENDYGEHTIEAESAVEVLKIIEDLYEGLSEIPFSIEIQNK